jgi:hypothetical protein
MENLLRNLGFLNVCEGNWFFDKYYYGGGNLRYWTFQLALNLLYQRTSNPVIIETGCQRYKNDLGAGMSTSIFSEYCSHHGGHLYSIDISKHNINECAEITKDYGNVISFVNTNSLEWLRKSELAEADLIYLDSLDYPLSADGKSITSEDLKVESQRHCLAEFNMGLASRKITDQTIVLADDNQLPGGGKPKLLKEMLYSRGWLCLFDLQQTLWISPSWVAGKKRK